MVKCSSAFIVANISICRRIIRSGCFAWLSISLINMKSFSCFVRFVKIVSD